MTTQFFQNLALTTSAGIAQNPQFATVKFSYQGLTPQQTIKGSFSYAANFAGSVVKWNDLTTFTIAYNGDTEKNQVELERLFTFKELSYYLYDVTSNYGEQIKAGSFYSRLSNDCEVLEYTYVSCPESYDMYAAVSSSKGYWRAEEMLEYRQTYSSAAATIADVGIWLVDKVSGITTQVSSCSAS